MTGVLKVQMHGLGLSGFLGDQGEVLLLGEIGWQQMSVPCARVSGTQNRLKGIVKWGDAPRRKENWNKMAARHLRVLVSLYVHQQPACIENLKNYRNPHNLER